MRAGKLIELQEGDRLFDAPREDYTKELIANIPTF